MEFLGNGTAFKEVSTKVMQNFDIKIPCIQTQKRIANILFSLDDKIELNRRINCILIKRARILRNVKGSLFRNRGFKGCFDL